MKTKLFFLGLLASLGISQGAFAYFVAIPHSQSPARYDQPTHILVSGRGTDLGIQVQLSALGRAQLYKRNFSQNQVILISVLENGQNEAALMKAGWIFLVKNDLKLETDGATREILKFQKIRSLEFFGHNSPSLGTQTDGLGFRFDFRKPVVASIASHFENGAFAMIHGCNSGWMIAQALSKSWGIAVAGSFTGTRFERLHSNGHFYVYEEGKAPDNNWATFNPDLNGAKCFAGGCFRMRPAYSHYVGKWGNLEGPLLNHYKFFCQASVQECETAMATSLFGFLAEKSLSPTSSLADFREVAQQYLCPVYKDRRITEDCLQRLAQAEDGHGPLTFSYVVNNPQLTCDLRSCSGVMSCGEHSCSIAGRLWKNSDTLAQEYLHLINGFKSLKHEGF
jgi:hypothetical protein